MEIGNYVEHIGTGKKGYITNFDYVFCENTVVFENEDGGFAPGVFCKSKELKLIKPFQQGEEVEVNTDELSHKDCLIRKGMKGVISRMAFIKCGKATGMYAQVRLENYHNPWIKLNYLDII